MTTTADNLAHALRALYPLVPFDGNHDDETRKGPQLAQARAALAEYDSAAPVVSAADVARKMRQRAAEHRARNHHARAAELEQFAARLEN